METSLGNSYPQLCFDVGLTCESCVAETATQLARACKGLRGKAIRQLFVQIHPHPACAAMHSRFAQVYQENSGREALPEQPIAMAAVA